jgi:hypothetical protein
LNDGDVIEAFARLPPAPIVSLAVVDEKERSTYHLIGRHTCLSKLLDRCCAREGLDKAKWGLYEPRSCRVLPNTATAHECSLEDGDILRLRRIYTGEDEEPAPNFWKALWGRLRW